MLSVMRRVASAVLLGFVSIIGPSAWAQAVDQTKTGDQVRISSDPGVVLAGTLQKPNGTGPFPVAVIVAGTGPWKRGGFADIRTRLLAHGIATLEYDKRGQGESTGIFVDTLPAMERDVAASVAFLRNRHDIDPARIALVGQSQGGVAVPFVASHDPKIAAVVMLSGPVGPRGELFLSILRANLTTGGKSPEGIRAASAAVGAWMGARSRGVNAAELKQSRATAIASFGQIGLTEKALDALDNDVVLSMYEAAPDQVLANVKAPVLAVYGSEDEIIAPTLSVRAAEAALSGNRDALVLAVPGMTHELQRATPDKAESQTGGDGTMPVVTDIVGAWLAKRLGTLQRDN